MVQTWTHGLDMDSWYSHGLRVLAKTHGMDNTHGIDLNSQYSIGTTKSHTRTRGPSAVRMRDFCKKKGHFLCFGYLFVVFLFLISSHEDKEGKKHRRRTNYIIYLTNTQY